MSDQQPDVRWAPLEPKPKRTNRALAVVGLSLLTVIIVAAVLFFLLPHDGSPTPDDSATPSATQSTPGTPTPTESDSDGATPPAPAEPTIDAFRAQVELWLTDAPRGLDIIEASSTDQALPVMDSLEQDARRLSDALPPSSLQAEWSAGVGEYSQQLAALRSVIQSAGDTTDAIGTTRAALNELAELIGV